MPAPEAFDLSGLTQPETYADSSKPVNEEIVNWVEGMYEWWMEHPTRWQTFQLGSDGAVLAAISEGRRYCNEVRETPLTFQLKSAGTGDGALTCRVRESLRRSDR
jgi:hypothetical protein